MVAGSELVEFWEGAFPRTFKLYTWLGPISSSCVIDAQMALPWFWLLLVHGREMPAFLCVWGPGLRLG